jgi:acetyl/propionyl-CoA carboxylase alpha subunit
MFSKILIANRGEIAVRIIKTCRRMGIATVVVYSEADALSLAVEMADETVFIGPPPANESYLVAEKIIAAAHQTGAQAIHPGFGFLSEKASFARQCAEAGVVFIGPNPGAIDAMGDKIESKKFAAAANVSVVPGHVGEIDDVAHATRISEEIGYPVMIKASAGGGGKGIRVAWNRKDVEEGFPAVRAEAKGAFGDDRIFIEKFIVNPRHIEIQVLGDKHGHVVHLFERECSIQRRNQKVIEEAPSPLLDAATRAAMGAQAIALAQAVDYDSAGTVEFVAGQDKSFYFLEMNTRLQVEHPVTELITGVDLVEQMIRVAAGEPLAFTQDDLAIKGWAIESRIYAEDPYRKFLPSIGRLSRYQPPAEGERDGWRVRNDTGVREGDEISMFYDPMIATLCAWAPDRAGARRVGNGLTSPLARSEWVVVIGKRRRRVRLSDEGGALHIAFPDEDRTLTLDALDWRPGSPMLRGRLDGRDFTVTVAPAVEGFMVRHRAASLRVLVLTPLSADLHERLPEKTPPDTSRLVVSPMPGLVVSMDVKVGDEVKEGEVICVIEAMKMQNILRAERDGLVKTVGAKAGDSVAADDVLAEFA